jgi:hypothetical protein
MYGWSHITDGHTHITDVWLVTQTLSYRPCLMCGAQAFSAEKSQNVQRLVSHTSKGELCSAHHRCIAAGRHKVPSPLLPTTLLRGLQSTMAWTMRQV